MTEAEPVWAVQGGGTKYAPPDDRLLDRRLRQADKAGEHLWVVTAAWRISNPEDPFSGVATHLDPENLVMIAGPGCFKCEHPYSKRLARKVCRGTI